MLQIRKDPVGARPNGGLERGQNSVEGLIYKSYLHHFHWTNSRRVACSPQSERPNDRIEDRFLYAISAVAYSSTDARDASVGMEEPALESSR